MDAKTVYAFLEDFNFEYFTMFLITEKRLGNIVGIFAEKTIMDLFELFAEVIVGHVEYSKVISALLLLELLLISISHNFVPEVPILYTCQPIPGAFPPWVA